MAIPYVNIKIIQEGAAPDQKAQLVRGVTQLLVADGALREEAGICALCSQYQGKLISRSEGFYVGTYSGCPDRAVKNRWVSLLLQCF
jgi:hypothetical protein